MNKHLWLAAAILLAGCGGGAETRAPATADSANQAIASAEASVKKASEVGYEWRDTAKLITSAKAAAEKQEFDKAMDLANQADRQGQLAFQQYEREGKAAR